MKMPSGPARGGLGFAATLVFGAFVAIAAFLLVAEHRAHVPSFLPWVLLAACPLLHMFMHRHHGHERHRAGDARGEGPQPPEASP